MPRPAIPHPSLVVAPTVTPAPPLPEVLEVVMVAPSDQWPNPTELHAETRTSYVVPRLSPVTISLSPPALTLALSPPCTVYMMA